MRTRLDETNKMRKLMGLSLIMEQTVNVNLSIPFEITNEDGVVKSGDVNYNDDVPGMGSGFQVLVNLDEIPDKPMKVTFFLTELAEMLNNVDVSGKGVNFTGDQLTLGYSPNIKKTDIENGNAFGCITSNEIKNELDKDEICFGVLGE